MVAAEGFWNFIGRPLTVLHKLNPQFAVRVLSTFGQALSPQTCAFIELAIAWKFPGTNPLPVAHIKTRLVSGLFGASKETDAGALMVR